MAAEFLEHRRSEYSYQEAGPPPHGTVEVNLFGPGYGESVVVHLGDGTWLIVDSCSSYDEGAPIALDYLQAIGVDFSSVRYILATHWHDDHIRGLAQIVKKCTNAEVFVSQALRHEGLMRLVLVQIPRHVTNLREMSRVIKSLLERPNVRGQKYRYLAENTAVEYGPNHPQNDVQIWALSPSSEDITLALRRLEPYLVPLDVDRLPSSIARPNENHASAVLYLRIGEQSVLLGADREILTSQGRGWKSVNHAARGRQLARASLLKVPHHGSPNGDAPEIWSDLMESNPVAFVAPFRRGLQGGRPREGDVARLCSRTQSAFTTSVPDVAGPGDPGLTEAVPAQLESIGDEEVEDAQLPLGHLRARSLKAGGPWIIEMFGPAGHLCTAACALCE